MSAAAKGSLKDRLVGLKNYLPFVRGLSLRVKNTPFEEKLKKIAELIETGTQ